MSVLAMKEILGAIAFSALALKWAFDWKAVGWFGHTLTVAAVLFAAISLSLAVYDLATGQ